MRGHPGRTTGFQQANLITSSHEKKSYTGVQTHMGERKYNMFSLTGMVLVLVAALNVYGQDVQETLDKSCYDVGDSMTLTATYVGSDTYTAVIWYFSGRDSQNIIVLTAGCSVFQTDPGFPTGRMTYKCPPNTADSNTYQVILSSLVESDLGSYDWGATFQVSAPLNPDVVTEQPVLCQTTTEGCWCCLIDCKDIEIGECYFANVMIYIIIFVVFFIIVGIVVEAIFNIWEKMSSTWRILSFVVFLFGIGLFICNYIKRRTAGTKKKIYSCVIGSCLVSTGTGTGLYYKLLRDEQKEGNITPLSKSSGDTITIGCLLPGTFTCPEWRGPPSFTPFTNFNDCTINPEVPAASRLLYDTDNRSLILSNAQTNDSGDYKCAYTKKGDHTIRLTVNPATNNASTYGTTTTSASTYDTTTTSAPTYGTTQKPSSGEKLPVCLMGCIFSTVIAVVARLV